MSHENNPFSIVPLNDYFIRRLDFQTERLGVNELIADDNSIVQGYATSPKLREHAIAATFLAQVIKCAPDNAFNRVHIDFHILTKSLGATGLRAVGYLFNDSRYPAFAHERTAAYWAVSPLPIDPPDGTHRYGHIQEGFFTVYPGDREIISLLLSSEEQ